jgi:hypothetical protein
MGHMTPTRIITALATIGLLLALPGAALAQTGTTTSTDPLGVTVQLAALFPWVILASSLVLSPDHHAAVKRLIPGAITVIASGIYFVVEGWPGLGTEVVAGIGSLAALSLTAYQPVSALLELVTGRTLNRITGPGIPFGPTELDEH